MRLVIQDRVMNHTAVIPNHQIAHLPAMAMNKLDMLAMRMKVGQYGLALIWCNAIHVSGVRGADVKRFPARNGVCLHHGV